MDKLAHFLSKYVFVFIVILAIISFAAIGWYIEKLAYNITKIAATEDAGKYSTTVSEFRNFYSERIIPNLKQVPGITITHDYLGKKGDVPFPATMSIDFSQVLSQHTGGAIVRVFSNYPWPWRQAEGGPHDAFEKDALNVLKANPSIPFSRIETYNGQPALRYATAVVMKDSCIGCHNNDPDSPIKNWKVGDVRGVQEIILPLTNITKESHRAVLQTLIIMIVVTIIALFLLYMTLHGLRRSLRLTEEANRNLEERVNVRTKELNDKNSDLEKTLHELKQTQQQMIVQEKMASLGQLTAGIAHEIKNPLNFVNNFAELSIELIDELQELLQKPDAELDKTYIESLLTVLKNNCDKINTHGKRADGIVKNMLMHSRGASTEQQPTDLNALLDEYTNLAYHGLRAQDYNFNAKIEKHFAPDLENISVFPQEIGRVFLNIINNALYASNKKLKHLGPTFMPTLSIITEQTARDIVIKIRDNGDGIPKNILDKVFNPFFTTKPAGEGTGLGLSICYDIIVQEHHGKLEINTIEGEYTEFVITLPKR